jgi:multiple sugar transport system substrate-binding protein
MWTYIPLLVVLITAATCESGPEPPPSEPGRTTITWFTNSAEVENDPTQILIDAFERQHPEITVNAVSGPYNTDDKRSAIRAEIESGENPPDVYMGDVIWPAEFGAAGLALPLDEHFPPEFWDRFRDGSDARLLEAEKYQGKTYAVPFYEDQGVLYYRKDLLEERGLGPPETWQQLVEIAKRLQAEMKVKYGFVGQGASYEGLTCNWLEMLTSAGGRTLDEGRVRSEINSPQALEATRFIRSLVEKRVTPLEVAELEEPQAYNLFGSGAVAFIRGWNSGYGKIKDKFGRDVEKMVGVAPLPTFEGRTPPGYSTVGGWNLYVNPNTTKLRAALTFIDWMTDLPAQGIVAQFSEIPTNRNARADPDITDSDANPALAVAIHARQVYRPALTPAYPELSAAIYRNVNDVLTGKATPEDALARADKEADGILTGAGPVGPPPAGPS